MITARSGARALAFVAVALSAFAFATGTPDQKNIPPKKESSQNDVYIDAHPAEWVCYDAPYKVTVYYTAVEDNLRLTLTHSGNKVTPAYYDVAKTTGSVEFEIDYPADTTTETLTAILHAKNDVSNVKASYARTDLCFLKGMMFAKKEGALKAPKRTPPVELPEGVREAAMADARKGKQVPAGFHHGEFAPRDKYIHGGQVRFWVQSRYKGHTPKMEYDRTATLIQQPRGDGKWEPKWYEILPTDLGDPKPPTGTSYIVIVALLDGAGRVLEMRPHW